MSFIGVSKWTEAGDNSPAAAFRYLSSATLLVSRSDTLPPEISNILWKSLLDIVKTPDITASKSLCCAHKQLLIVLSGHSQGILYETSLCADLLSFCERRSHYFNYSATRHFALEAISAVLSLHKDGLRHSAINVFSALSDLLKSNMVPHSGYRYAILKTLNVAALVAGCGFDYNHEKSMWKLARDFTADRSALVASVSYELVGTLSSPAMINGNARVTKVVNLHRKGLQNESLLVVDSSARLLATLVNSCDRLSLQSAFSSACEYYAKHPQCTNGIALTLEYLVSECTPDILESYSFFLGQFMTIKASHEVQCHAQYVLGELVARIVKSEQGRLALVRILIQQLVTFDKTRQDQMIVVVRILRVFLRILGNAIEPLQSHLTKTLFGVLHNSSSSQLSYALVDTLVVLIEGAPSLLLETLRYSLDTLVASPKLEYAYLTARLTALTPSYSAQTSLALNTQVLSSAVNFIRESQQINDRKDLLKFSSGWVLLQGIMCLGHSMIKPYVPQLVLLWERWLDSRAFDTDYNPLQLKLVLSKRLGTLTSLCVFMVQNPILMTTDLTNTIAASLHQFYHAFSKIPQKIVGHQELSEVYELTQLRIFQCYSVLLEYHKSDNYPADMLLKALQVTTEGCTTPNTLQPPRSRLRPYFEPTYSCQDPDHTFLKIDPRPKAVASVDAALKVIVGTLLLQHSRVQEGLFDRLRSTLESGRSQAIDLNAAYILRGILLQLKATGSLEEPRISKILQDICWSLLDSPYARVRELVGYSCGVLGSILNSTSVLNFTKQIVDKTLSNKSADLRAGNALALGYIIKHARGVQTLNHLEAVMSILLPLAWDPNPVVHKSAIEGMALAWSDCSFFGIKEVQKALNNLKRLYLDANHSEMVATPEYSNLGLEYPAAASIAQGVTVLVSLAGPDLQDNESVFELAYTLTDYLQTLGLWSDEVVAESWNCLQQLFFFTKGKVQWGPIIKTWVSSISDESASSSSLLGHVAAESILALFKVSAIRVLEVAGREFENHIWLALDADPSNTSLREILLNWLEQTGPTHTTTWVARVMRVVMRPRAVFEVRKAIGTANKAVDSTLDLSEEKETFKVQPDQVKSEVLSWSTRQVAIELLLVLLRNTAKERQAPLKADSPIAKCAGEMIKIAFSAATSSVLFAQVLGLELLEEIIIQLADVVDEDMPTESLLQQHQAQISSAITPAFKQDSTPELALKALSVCGTFIRSGIVKESENLSRLVRILEESLDTFSGSGFKLGNLELIDSAQEVLKIALLGLWASLETASETHEYIVDIVEPRRPQLLELWTECLKKYATSKYEPESSSTTSLAASAEQMKSEQLKHILLETFESTWVEIANAVARVIQPGEGYKDLGCTIFGLSFQLLVEQPSCALRLKALDTLQRLLKGPISQQILEDEIFCEFAQLLDRIVLTGSAVEQLHVVRIVQDMSVSLVEDDNNVDKLFELFRIAMLPLTVMFPCLAEYDNISGIMFFKGGNEAECLDLAKFTLDALVAIVQRFRSVIRNDIFGCVLYIFEGIWQLEATQENLAPHVISSFKCLIECMCKVRDDDSDPETRTLVDAALTTAFVDAQQRLENASGDALSRRNMILTCMVLLSSGHSALTPASGNIAELGRQLASAVGDSEVGAVATESIRAILTRTRENETVYGGFVHGCIPQLVSAIKGPFETENVARYLCELLVQHALQSAGSLHYVLPALVCTLKEGGLGDKYRYYVLQPRLFELVRERPDEFRDVVQELVSEDRELLQNLLVDGGEDQDEFIEEEEIALTSFA